MALCAGCCITQCQSLAGYTSTDIEVGEARSTHWNARRAELTVDNCYNIDIATNLVIALIR
jgi:hypothetical protein